uniref:Uncharacterized protein n=1 Tax=Octopus bimaculoides TaxID=37653 RepID=A0A0L8HKH5_OCTBM
MDACGKKRLLMVMTSGCAGAAFGLLCIAVATDYWLFTSERIQDASYNTSAIYKRTYSGLWRKCERTGESTKNTFISFWFSLLFCFCFSVCLFVGLIFFFVLFGHPLFKISFPGSSSSSLLLSLLSLLLMLLSLLLLLLLC